MKKRAFLILPFLVAALHAAEPVTLTLADFTDGKGGKPGAGWVEADGVIHLTRPAKPKDPKAAVDAVKKAFAGGNIISKEQYDNFELEWEWKLSEAGNSGIKYWVTKHEKGGLLGIEYQMLDDDKHPDSKKENHRNASIYDIKAASADKPNKAIGEWNQSKIVAKDGKVEHWLNGKLVASSDTKSAEWKELLGKSKFAKNEGFAPGKGHLMLTDHNDEVWWRNIRIKTL